ncbi:MAG TPA: hypothetical protein VKU00_27335, partial [Chthonomonadaceae bacterium]|nr:hypothetical protein [Chthonomonadaceae bacterium]
CDFQPDWQQGVNQPYPDYGYMRGLVRLFAVQAVLQCDAKQPLQALHSLRIAAQITRHLGQDPRIYSLATRFTLDSILERPLIRTVQQFGHRPEVLAGADAIEDVLDTPMDFEQALRGECLMRLQTIALLHQKDRKVLFSGYPPPYPPHVTRGEVQDAWEARCLSFWRRIFAHVHASGGDPMEMFREVRAVTEEEKANSAGQRRHFKPTYEMNYYLEPDCSDTAQRLIVITAHQRLRRTQLALFAYRLKTGHFPESLEALSPTLPLDPFSHQPLHYRRTEQGFLLYSVGVNLADDNGDGSILSRGQDPPDIVISYPTLPSRF